jgi:hypothetical protein
LELLGDESTREFEICFVMPNGEEKVLMARRPPTKDQRLAKTSWKWASTQSRSFVAHKVFPYDLLAVPEGGSYNPRSTESFVIVRLDDPERAACLKTIRNTPEGSCALWVQTSPEMMHAARVPNWGPGESGLYRIPIRRTPLGAVVELSVGIGDEGVPSLTTLRFSMRAREFEARTRWSGETLSLALTGLLIPGGDKTEDPFPVYCTVFLGDAVLAAQSARVAAGSKPTNLTFSIPARVQGPLGVGCDTGPFVPALDSVSMWVWPEDRPTQLEPWLEAIWGELEDRVGKKQAQRFRADAVTQDPTARARARILSNLIIPPQAPGIQFVSGSFGRDFAALGRKYRKRRLILMGTLLVVLLTWLSMTLYALRINRRERYEALDFLSREDTSGGASIPGAEMFSRPRSGLLAFSVLLVMVLSMVGLMWVLFWL